MEKSGVFPPKKWKRRDEIWLLGNKKKHIFLAILEEKKPLNWLNLTRKKTTGYTQILNPSTLVKHFLYSKELREFP